MTRKKKDRDSPVRRGKLGSRCRCRGAAHLKTGQASQNSQRTPHLELIILSLPFGRPTYATELDFIPAEKRNPFFFVSPHLHLFHSLLSSVACSASFSFFSVPCPRFKVGQTTTLGASSLTHTHLLMRKYAHTHTLSLCLFLSHMH